MAIELKATVINLKSLSQNIPDPIVVGAGDAAGRKLRVIFTQEAAAQFTSGTKVYLSWLHQEKNIKGYNVFTEITDEEDEDFPPTWEITYPKAMLYEGNVLACIQIVDDISIATSVNFTIHVLIDPNAGQTYTETDDYSDFQKMIIQISSLADRMEQQMLDQKIEFEDMQLAFMQVQRIANEAGENSLIARRYAEQALEVANSIAAIAEEANALALKANNNSSGLKERVEVLEEKLDNLNIDIEEYQNLVDFINNWEQKLEEDIEPRIQLAKTEVLNQLEKEVQAAEAEHQEIWDALQIAEFIEEEGE